MATSWLRQFQVLTTKNRRQLLRRPFHLLILLLSSVISVVLAFFAGRDLRGPTGEFPPLTDCGVVDPMYLMLDLKWEDLTYEERYNIPKSLNESWRGGLPIWILSLGPSLAAISAFLIIREELVSKRWGMLKSADISTQWFSWSFSFFVCGIINSLAGGTTAAVMPNIHAFESVNFALVFGSLLFLNMALVACSFFLAALCGTIQSTTLTVFLIMGMIVAGSVPAIAASSTNFATYSASLNTYSHPTGAGSFWEYGSTERIMVEYGYEDNYDDLTGEYINTTTTNEMTQCEVPLVSYEQGHLYKTSAERDAVPASDIFEGCYVIAGSQARFGSNNFFWYMIPQTHFLAAWSNILGYTGLPGNVFSIDKATMSPEELSFEALANFKGGKSYDQSNTNNRTSLFAQGSTILPDVYYDWTQYNYNYDSMEEIKSTCPSSGLSNLCSDFATECYFPRAGFPSSGSPSFNDDLGYMLSLVIIYSILAAYFSAVFPMSNGARSKFYFPFQRKFWCSNRRWNGGNEDDAVEASGVSKKYGKVEALKPFSLTMKSSQLTALLGHNGAGKSTFVNLLCCEQNAASGDINVMGVPLSDQYAIRKMIGECKQDDILWPNLSAKEHLELFAGLRGVSQDEIAFAQILTPESTLINTPLETNRMQSNDNRH